MRKNKNLYFTEQSARPKRQWNKTALKYVIAIVATVIVSVIIAVLFGLILGKKAASIPDDTETTADFVSKSNYTVQTEAECQSLDKLPENLTEGTTVSVTIRDSDGLLYYDSVFAKAVGISVKSSSVSLTEMIDSIHGQKARISLCFYSTAWGESNSSYRKQLIDIEQSEIFELLNYGPDEIVIGGLPTDADSYSEVSDYLKTVSSKSGNTAVGAAIAYAGLYPTVECDSLKWYSLVDFILLDLNGASDQADEYVEDENGNFTVISRSDNPEKIYEELQTTIVAYNIRLLLTQDMTEQIQKINDAGCHNWQVTDFHKN